MAAKSLADRVAALEEQVGSKTIQEQFREQAELIDRLFAYRFEELDKKWGPRFQRVEQSIGQLQQGVGQLQQDVGYLQRDVKHLQKDMVIVREGIGILLKRRSK